MGKTSRSRLIRDEGQDRFCLKEMVREQVLLVVVESNFLEGAFNFASWCRTHTRVERIHFSGCFD